MSENKIISSKHWNFQMKLWNRLDRHDNPQLFLCIQITIGRWTYFRNSLAGTLSTLLKVLLMHRCPWEHFDVLTESKIGTIVAVIAMQKLWSPDADGSLWADSFLNYGLREGKRYEKWRESRCIYISRISPKDNFFQIGACKSWNETFSSMSKEY